MSEDGVSKVMLNTPVSTAATSGRVNRIGRTRSVPTTQPKDNDQIIARDKHLKSYEPPRPCWRLKSA